VGPEAQLRADKTFVLSFKAANSLLRLVFWKILKELLLPVALAVLAVASGCAFG
jgi:hypothetical protein